MKLLKLSRLGTILTFFLLTSSYALEWREIMQKARTSNKEIIAERFSIEAAKKSKYALYAGHLPVLNFVAERFDLDETEPTLNSSTGLISNTKTETKFDRYGFEVALNIFDGFKTVNSIRLAEAKLNYKKASKKVIERDIYLALRTAYFSNLLGRKRLRLAKKLRRRQKFNLNFVKLKYKGGLEPKWSYEKAKSDYGMARFNVNDANNALEHSRMDLLYLMGDENSDKKVYIVGSLERELSNRVKLRRRILSHPLMQSLKYQEVLAKRNENIAASGFSPRVSLGYKKTKSLLENDLEAKNTSLSINITVPLFKGFSTVNTYLAKKRERKSIEFAKRFQKSKLLNEIEKARLNYELKLKELDVVRGQLRAAEGRRKVVTKQYQSGRKSFLEWEQSESKLIENEKLELKKLGEALSAKAAYEFSLGYTVSML